MTVTVSAIVTDICYRVHQNWHMPIQYNGKKSLIIVEDGQLPAGFSILVCIPLKLFSMLYSSQNCFEIDILFYSLNKAI
jgi:hypothetical protein